MRRSLSLHAAATAFCVAALFAAPAAQARTLFDIGSSDLDVATVVTNRQPAWVQAAVASAPLYASDVATNQEAVSAKLPKYTFMRVLSSGAARLQVETYDENGAAVQSGWVDPTQVLPSVPATDWLVASAAATLWSTADSNANAARNLVRFTPLQQLDGPVQGRLQVRVYNSDFSAVVDQGWVDASSTGPALAPQVRVPSPTDRPVGVRSTNSSNQQQAFLDATAPAARSAAALTGVPASVTVAQAGYSTDPSYADKLVSLMDRYNLYQLDA